MEARCFRETKMTKTAAERLAWINESLAAGKTVFVVNHMRAWQITPKLAAKFEKIGRPVFKATEKSLYMSNGNRYDCIDYCGIKAQ